MESVSATCLRVNQIRRNFLRKKFVGVAPRFENIDYPKKNQSVLEFFRKNAPLYGDAPCLNDSDVITYMNDPKVRKAINIPFNLPKWDICR